LNTTLDGTGTEVKVVINASGDAVDIDTDGDGASDILIIPVLILNDITAPTPGSSGAITTTDVLKTSLTLNWTKATDNGIPDAFQRYKVIQSTSANISTIADALTSGGGRTVLKEWSFDLATQEVTGLTAETTYYFTILVMDAAGNLAIYTTKTQATADLEILGNWSMVGGDSDGVINYASAADAATPDLIEFNSKLYATWSEPGANEQQQIRMKEWDGTLWSFIDGGTDEGINKSTNSDGHTPQLTVFSSKLYATWSESTTVHVKEWDGTDWVFVDGTGINSSDYAYDPQLTVFNSRLYVTWEEREANSGNYQYARVQEWDGNTTWTSVDGGKLNYDSGDYADNPQLTEFNSNLYAIWSEDGNPTYQIRVKEWNGSSWSFFDDDDSDPETGLNYNIDKAGYEPQLIEFNSKLYAVWSEAYGESSVKQIRVRKWDGTSTWSFIDGDSNTGLNFDTGKDAYNPKLSVFDSKLYATWSEKDTNTSFILRVKEWDGTNWTFVDGNTASGLNQAASTSKGEIHPQLIEFDSQLHIIWDEGGTSSQKIRVKKAVME
jgi:hypothetical protein